MNEDQPFLPRIRSVDEVAAAFGKSRSWVDRIAKSDPNFPRPRRVGTFSVGYLEHEIAAYINALSETADAPVHHAGRLHLRSPTGKKSRHRAA